LQPWSRRQPYLNTCWYGFYMWPRALKRESHVGRCLRVVQLSHVFSVLPLATTVKSPGSSQASKQSPNSRGCRILGVASAPVSPGQAACGKPCSALMSAFLSKMQKKTETKSTSAGECHVACVVIFFFVRCVTCDLQRDACVWRDAYATCGGMFAAYTFGECDGKAVGLGQSRGRRLLSPVACDACRVMCDMMRVKCDTRDVAGAMWRLA
jgi:hypothetical protein